MKTVRSHVVVLLVLVACTPAQRGQALVGVGVSACAAGHGAEAAGQGWGGVLASVGCWLADWAADREDRRRAAERVASDAAARGLELAPAKPVGDYEQVDAAAVALSEARARMIADPCPANFDGLQAAYARCRELAPGLGRPRE
jgi:hypothetical protein